MFAASDVGLFADSCGHAREARVGHCGMALPVPVVGVVKSSDLARIFAKTYGQNQNRKCWAESREKSARATRLIATGGVVWVARP